MVRFMFVSRLIAGCEDKIAAAERSKPRAFEI